MGYARPTGAVSGTMGSIGSFSNIEELGKYFEENKGSTQNYTRPEETDPKPTNPYYSGTGDPIPGGTVLPTPNGEIKTIIDPKLEHNLEETPVNDSGDPYEDLGPRPEMPGRKWYDFLPFFNQKYEDELARWQTDYDWWMTQNQRIYDSQKEQKKRWDEAGLNPNLMYTQGQTFSGGKGSGTKPLDKESFQTTVKGLAKGALMAAQIGNIESVRKLNNLKAITEASKAGVLDEQAAGLMWANKYAEKTLDSRVEAAAIDVGIKKQLQNKSEEEVKILKQDLKNKKVQGEILEIEKDLNDLGIYTNDPMLLRLTVRNYQNEGLTKNQITQRIVEDSKTWIRKGLELIGNTASSFGVSGASDASINNVIYDDQ